MYLACTCQCLLLEKSLKEEASIFKGWRLISGRTSHSYALMSYNTTYVYIESHDGGGEFFRRIRL